MPWGRKAPRKPIEKLKTKAKTAAPPTSVAVTTSGDRSTVTVVGDDGTQTVTAIEVGVVGEDYTEVTSGVETGQQIVLTSATATDDDSDQFQVPGGGGGFGGGFGGGAGTPPNMGGGAR